MNGLELWLVRHAQSTFNLEKRIQGQSDAPLSELGVQQAQSLGNRLATESFEQIYTSDLRRTVQTAEIACPKVALTKDIRLREINLGVLQGTLESEHTEEQAAMLEHFRADNINHRVPEGENFSEVRERVLAWQRSLPSSGRVIAFTHGGVIYTLLQTLIGEPPGGSWSVAGTGITRLQIVDEKITLEVFNDHSHLPKDSRS